MIEAKSFVETAKLAGFSLYTGVPCSYVKPFINYVIDAPDLAYIGAANEGDAVAIATGAELGGKRAIAMMQNSGLGNAVSPLTSLNAIFKIPTLLIVTLRGEPGGPKDEPQHELMGQITIKMLETMNVGWAYFPTEESEVAGALEKAIAYMAKTDMPFAFVMKKDSVAPHKLTSKPTPRDFAAKATKTSAFPANVAERPSRTEALRAVQRALRPEDIVVATTGFTGRELYACDDRPNQLYMVGSMGCASTFGLGLAWARPDRRVIVLDGDGALLMRMGCLATIGYERPKNLVHVLLDNEAHDSTGTQSTVTHSVDLGACASACGYPAVEQIAGTDALEKALADRTDGLRFLHVKTKPGAPDDLPRPKITPREVATRLKAHLSQALSPVAGAFVILLNPGPVSMTATVRAALAGDDVCHREPEFKELVGRVRTKISAIYSDAKAFTPILIGGSGTSAVETMLSVIAPTETSLVVANGVYGERMAAMLRAQNKRHEVVSAPWTSGMDLAAAEKAITSGSFGHVLAVHHETTTGRLNDLAGLGAICKKAGVPLLVDAVSSFAGEEIRWDDWNIEAAGATANKCVHGAPGVSFVLVRNEALSRPSGATSVYLDLHRHAADQAKGSTPFTLPTHVTFALDAALEELAASGGWKARHATYTARSNRVRSVLRELGVSVLLENESVYGATLTSFRLPEGKTYEALHAQLKKDGFVIYAGQGKFDGAIFRIAVMGEITERDLNRLVVSLGAALT